MAQSTGKRLQEARLVHGFSLEDVQHLTRIRLTQLAGMENEDLTVFASPSYARGFYALYARFLGVDLTEFLATMESEGLKPVKHHPYLRRSPDRVTHSRRAHTLHSQPLPQAGRLALLGTAMLLLIGAAAWFGNAHLRRSALGQDNARTSAEPTPANLPLFAGTSPASLAPQPASEHPEISPSVGASEGLSQVDVRSNPPPVLKALPVDDAANRRPRSNAERSNDRRPAPEVRRPAPFTR